MAFENLLQFLISQLGNMFNIIDIFVLFIYLFTLQYLDSISPHLQ